MKPCSRNVCTTLAALLLARHFFHVPGPVEVDETCLGGKERNQHAKAKLRAGQGPIGKTAIAGIRDRNANHVMAKVVKRTDKKTMQGFIRGKKCSAMVLPITYSVSVV